MKFPLVRDLVAEGFPVRLTCGVLGFSGSGVLQVAGPTSLLARLGRCPEVDSPLSEGDPLVIVVEYVDVHGESLPPTIESRWLGLGSEVQTPFKSESAGLETCSRRIKPNGSCSPSWTV